MSSQCVCHLNEWCFYCEMYSPLQAEHDRALTALRIANRRIEELERSQQAPRAPAKDADRPKLTAKQSNVYQVLTDYINDHGFAPSNRELAEMVGLLSASTLNGHLGQLEKKGYIKIIGPRAIKIL